MEAYIVQVLKVARLRDELRRETYNTTTVAALNTVRNMLDSELARATSEKEALKEKVVHFSFCLYCPAWKISLF
jgi:hypothetical protein